MRNALERQERDALLARFEAAGATRIEADILQPADTLLDLYGEDIRARAYVQSPRATPTRGRSFGARKRMRSGRASIRKLALKSLTVRLLRRWRLSFLRSFMPRWRASR